MKLCACLVAVGVSVSLQAQAISSDHAFSVKDDIAMVRFSDPSSEPGVPGSDVARRSPDGKYLAIVTTKGLLESDQIESDVTVFRIKEVFDFLQGEEQLPIPRVIATIVSFPHREQTMAYAPVIKDLRWSPDMTSVYFRGESLQGAYRLYVARLDGSGFHAVTPADQSVDRYDVVTNTIAYKASEVGKDEGLASDTINADARAVTGERIQDIIFGDQLRAVQPETFTMWVLHHVGNQWVRRRISPDSFRDFTYLSGFFPFAISPNGTKLIAITPVASVPDSWKRYEPAKGFDHMRLLGGDPRLTNADNVLRPQQYSLIDFASGKSIPLMDAPNARSLAYTLDNNSITWAADQRRVLVTNTFLRLGGNVGGDPSQDVRPCAVSSVDLPSLEPHCLFFEGKEQEPASPHVLDVSFGASNDEATVLLKRGPQEQVVRRYQFHDGEWLASSGAERRVGEGPSSLTMTGVSDHSDLTVSVRQDLNEPPTLWASDSESGKSREIWDPNPQLAHIGFGEASMYHWKDKTGAEWAGILVKPVDYFPGRRYPLVIQMYSFVDGQFLTDGLYPTAFAARHLASAGFVVLQVKKKPNTLSEADPKVHLEGYRSAIDSLFTAGLVDRSRVGVVGFSWTCWYAIDALIKEPTLFAAATIADGLDNSYMQYLVFGVGAYPVQQQIERIRGASPFGDGLKKWMEEAPGFHLDQVQTPVRIEAIDPVSILQEWELYASLRMQKKPVDVIYFPNGTHVHQKPLERLESQQGNVDWFRFWLQGYEDSDPSKHAQYERWERLRAAMQISSLPPQEKLSASPR